MYNVEEYWSDVAKRMGVRRKNRLVAGDSEPFYEYKRAEFLKLLKSNDFKDKHVLEVGPGPGGNLLEVSAFSPASITGVDISPEMVKLARENTKNVRNVEIIQINGSEIPLADDKFDIVYTATVLQHITDEIMLKAIIGEICRVSGNKVIICERIEKRFKGDALNHGRTVDYYSSLFESHNFNLKSIKYSNIQFSYLLAGFTRKVLNRKDRIEGEPLSKISLGIQNLLLPVTKVLDKMIPVKRDLAMLIFEKK